MSCCWHTYWHILVEPALEKEKPWAAGANRSASERAKEGGSMVKSEKERGHLHTHTQVIVADGVRPWPLTFVHLLLLLPCVVKILYIHKMFSQPTVLSPKSRCGSKRSLHHIWYARWTHYIKKPTKKCINYAQRETATTTKVAGRWRRRRLSITVFLPIYKAWPAFLHLHTPTHTHTHTCGNWHADSVNIKCVKSQKPLKVGCPKQQQQMANCHCCLSLSVVLLC